MKARGELPDTRRTIITVPKILVDRYDADWEVGSGVNPLESMDHRARADGLGEEWKACGQARGPAASQREGHRQTLRKLRGNLDLQNGNFSDPCRNQCEVRNL